MAFCSNCGRELKDGEKFCPACGKPVAAAESTQYTNADDLGSKVNKVINDVDNLTGQMSPADIEANKGMGILAYLSWLVLIPIFAAKDSAFARFHVNQGLILAICEIICWALSCVPVIKYFVWILDLAILILAIMGIINAAKGEAKTLPIVGRYTILK